MMSQSLFMFPPKKEGAILKAPSMRWCLSRYYVEADSRFHT